MKLYNPFKPHIVTNGDGNYYIRKFGMCGWEYLDRTEDYYWWLVSNKGYAKFDSLESAKLRFTSIGYNAVEKVVYP